MTEFGDVGQALFDSLVPASSNADVAAVSLVTAACRIADNLSRIADDMKDAPLRVENSRGDVIANPLLGEYRQQVLALRQLFITLNVGSLPEVGSGPQLFELIRGAKEA